MYESLPNELKQNGLFCLWRYETRKGKPTKVPYQVNGRKADVTNPVCYASFTVVMDVFLKGGYDGIGLGIFGDYAAVDIDNCITAGKVSETAQNIIDMLGSYTEFSPSGNGIRVICKAPELIPDKERYYTNNRKIGLEVYFEKKFVTLTGNAIGDHGVEIRTEELQQVLDTYMRKPVSQVAAVEAPGSFLSDASVISKASASANGEKFMALFNGEIPEGKSASEADQALCSILAFWCGGDTEQMDRLFRRSGLMREKWNRTDYQNATLTKAVRQAKEFFKPVAVSTADADFDDTLQTLISLDIVHNRRYTGDDVGAGRLMADVFRDIARFVPERKKWFVFDGKRWEADIGGLHIMELAKKISDSMLRYAATLKDEDDRKLVLKWCGKWAQRRFREIYIREAQSIYPIPMAAFDKDIYLFNCNNCTIDVRSGKAHEHTAEDLITKLSPVDYDPKARSERWEQFIDEIMCGDADLKRFFQKSKGYAVSGSVAAECIFFDYGETTRNGKGTLEESCLAVMGDYGITMRPESIALKNHYNSQAPSEDIARLVGVRFANISEPDKGMVLNAAKVKALTGGDTINARWLGENSFDFRPTHKLYVNANWLPIISDMTLFSSGRVIIIPFNRHFEEWEQDQTLKEEFRKPEVQSAILNWLLEGYRMLLAEGLTQPQAVRDAIGVYSHESDKLSQFIEEKLIPDNRGEERTAAVYEAYRDWCRDNGCFAENNKNFLRELRKTATIVSRRPTGGGEKTTLLTGFRLKSEFLA